MDLFKQLLFISSALDIKTDTPMCEITLGNSKGTDIGVSNQKRVTGGRADCFIKRRST